MAKHEMAESVEQALKVLGAGISFVVIDRQGDKPARIYCLDSISVRIYEAVEGALLRKFRSVHPLAAGLREMDLENERLPRVFQVLSSIG